MELEIQKNIVFKGANGRFSLLDVISPISVGHFPVLIFMHGFKGFKDWGHWQLIMRKIAAEGFHVVLFNASHNGGSIAEPIDFPDLEAFSKNTYSIELSDLNSIVDLIHSHKLLPANRMDKNQVNLIGHSRGGGICLLQAAQDKRINKVICWAALSNFYNRLPEAEELKTWKRKGVRYIKNGRTKQDMPMKYSFVEDLKKNHEKLDIETSVREMDSKLLIIHGTNDLAVSIQSAYDLKSWSKNSKLEIIEGANHVFGGYHPCSPEDLSPHAEKLFNISLAFLKN